MLLFLLLILFFSRKLFTNPTDKTIYQATALVGNTGNLGIPLGIALFGIESVPYTSIINIANIIFIYIFSVYFFARDKFQIKDAIYSIFKIPGIWFAILALSINYSGISINKHISTALEMGAYTSIVVQLLIFGMYISTIKLRFIPWKLALHISLVKHILLPLFGIFIISYFTSLNSFVSSILIMELMMPLAVNNVNLAALYNCKPSDVAATILISSSVFVILLYFYMELIKYILG